jgi:NADH dehydrogenase [ubiquinone] 1 alpha subcomplex assembly factor 6
MAEDEACLEMVRGQDHDRYLTALYAPAAARAGLFALYAFNIELARIRETVREPMIGEIRLTWWREAIEGAASGKPRKHPVAEALTPWLAPKRVPLVLLDGMIDGRLTDVYDTPAQTLDDVLTYADLTAGNLNEAALWVCLGRAPGEADRQAVRRVGQAWALTGLLRAVGFHAAMQRVYLPEEDLAAAGVPRESLFQGALTPALAPALLRLAEAAHDRLCGIGKPPKHGLPPFLLATLARDYLHRFSAAAGDIQQADFQAGAVSRQAKLAWAALWGRP